MSKIIIGLCTFVLLVITPSVKADPVVITGGSLSVVGILGGPNYTMTGQNFVVTAINGDQGNTPGCFPCVSGQPVSLSSFLTGSSLGRGTAIVDGVTFNNLAFVGQFIFSAGAAILPPDMVEVTVTTPFVFSGFIVGCTGSHLVCETEVFTRELVGQGTVTALFGGGFPFNGVTLYSIRSVTYTFEGAAAEIPEPMTILLLTSGLIGVGANLRKRSKQRKSGGI